MTLFFIPPNNKPTSKRLLFPIVTADTLLSNQHKKIIENIHKMAAIPDDQFQIIYQQLINNFVEFVQVLPTNKKAPLGSLIDEGLLRALFALQMQKVDMGEEQPDPLQTYTLFSASLLFDVASVINNYTVIISEKDGSFIQEWSPHKSKMKKSGGGDYYRIRPSENVPEPLNRYNSPLLARQLMPPAGFNWIAQDTKIFDSWLALLSDEKEIDHDLKPYLDSANQKILDKPLQKSFVPIPLNTNEPEETALAEDFLEWLQQGIKAKIIDFNTYDSDIHVIENGLFLEMSDIIKKFCAQSTKNPKWDQVFAQLKKVGFISLDETQKELAVYAYANLDTTKQLATILQSDLYNQKPPPNQPPQPIKSSKKPRGLLGKPKIRHGVEIFRPCFLLLLFANFLELPIEPDLIAAIAKKDKSKKKLLRLRRIRLRRARLRQLQEEIDEALRLQRQAILGK